MKLRLYLTAFILLISVMPVACQTITDHERDSLRSLVCTLVERDQMYRKGAIMDTVAIAQKNNDTAWLNHCDSLLYAQDVADIKLLCKIIDKVGFPNHKIFGADTCDMIGILIHWAKEFPEWFNSTNTIAMFKRETAKGNLRLSDIDMSEFFFVSFIHPGIKYMSLVNNARMAYGLTPYSKVQFLGKKSIDPMLSDNDVRQYRDRLPEN